jgi:ankyrin repeat protein
LRQKPNSEDDVLLAGGADPNSRADDSLFPLFQAAARGHYDAALTLLEHGANANLKVAGGTTRNRRQLAYRRFDLAFPPATCLPG